MTIQFINQKGLFVPNFGIRLNIYLCLDFITKQSDAINACDQRLKQLDDKNIFYADDEIGFFFKEVQKIQEALNEFTLK